MEEEKKVRRRYRNLPDRVRREELWPLYGRRRKKW